MSLGPHCTYLGGSLIALEVIDLFLRHQLHDDVCLRLFEGEAKALVRVVFLVGLAVLISVDLGRLEPSPTVAVVDASAA